MKNKLHFKFTLLVLAILITKASFSQTTEMIKDISTVSTSEIYTVTKKFKNHIYFNQTDDLQNITASLWKTDGNDNGTTKVKTNTGEDIIGAANFIIMNNELYFTLINDSSDYELWKTDGTNSTAEMVKDLSISGFKNPSDFFALDNLLLFRVFENGIGYRLVKCDGTDVTLVTGLFKYQSIIPKAVMGDYLYFNAEYVDNGSTTGIELCRTNGTGASMVKEIAVGTFPGSPIALGSNPDNFELVGNELFFVASSYLNKQLWKTDGTNAGTSMVKDISPNAGFNNLTAVGTTLYFTASDGINGKELWKSDGTPNGTVMVKDINGSANDSNVEELFNYNGSLFFRASNGTNGAELWKSDGTASGTIMLKNIANTNYGSGPGGFTLTKNEVYFEANDVTNGRELWKTDGTAAGTVLVADINSGGASNPHLFNSLGNLLIFKANDGTGEEIWKHNPCNLVPQIGSVNIEMDEDFVSATMTSGTVITEEGVYQDTVRNSLDCDSLINTYTLTKLVTGINDLNFQSITVFPNPTSGIINLNISETLTSLRIIDLTGKTIQVFNADSKQLDIRRFTQGIYFLEVANEEKKSVVKFIKK